jgi:hypothetical protein
MADIFSSSKKLLIKPKIGDNLTILSGTPPPPPGILAKIQAMHLTQLNGL